MVRLYRYIKDINTLAWRTGCLFTYEDTDARVIETYGNKKIEIRIKGMRCTNLASIIIKEMDELNDSFKELEVKKMIPCNCSDCKQSDNPDFHEYQDLLNRQKKGKGTIECKKSYEDASVQEILDGVYEVDTTPDKTIEELVKVDKLEEAIQVFEATHPTEAILLHQKYQEGHSYFMLQLGTAEAWSVTKRQIGLSLLTLSKYKSSLDTKPTAKTQASINQQLASIQQSIDQGFAATQESLQTLQDLTADNTADIMDWLEVAFKIRQVQELENFAQLEQTFLAAKKSSNWEAKLKLAVPLINLIGVKLETETKFDLKKYVTGIKQKAMEISAKYGVRL